MNYYNGGHLFSLNCFIAMLIGNRSTGKSFYVKSQCVKRFLKYGEQFIYVRRRDIDIKEVVPSWFDDISQLFPNYYVEHKKNTFYLCHDEIDGKGETQKVAVPMGYTIHLDGVDKIKSVPRGHVNTIFFDEFLPDNNVYLHRDDPFYEPERLISLYMSTARGYGKVIRPEVRIICVANNVSLYNPYFTYFKVNLVQSDKWFKDGVYAEKWINWDIAHAIEQTHVGKFISGSRYGQHALYNESLKDVETNISKPPANTSPLYCVYFQKWYTFLQGWNGNVYIKATNDKTLRRRYKLLDLPEVEGVPWYRGEPIKAMLKLAENECIFYDTMATKSVFAGIFLPKIIGG